MTRMKLFYIDKDGTCYRTVEFNGDGYCINPDDNGWIGLQHLIKWKFNINDMEKSFKDMMCVFNREAYDYPEDELDFYIARTCSGEELYKTIKHSYTDYIYIRNDGPDIETPAGIVKTGITVFNYGSLYNSKSIEQCIIEAKDSEPYETITVEIEKTTVEGLKNLNGWHKVSEELPTHNRAVAISPAFRGNEFACYNEYDNCWDTEDGDDCLCEIDKVKYWFEIPEAPKD